jgi:hypothetical protein
VAPAEFLRPPAVTQSLHDAISRFQDLVSDFVTGPRTDHRRAPRPVRTSGYRPPPYQAHLYELKVLRARLRVHLTATPADYPACRRLIDAIASEVRTHALQRRAVAAPFPDLEDLAVNPPGLSAHETYAAMALDLGVRAINGSILRRAADLSGVSRPFVVDDPVHFQLGRPARRLRVRQRRRSASGDAGPLATDGRVALLIVDPGGRRIGIDPATDQVVNDFGDLGLVATDDESTIDILAAALGDHTVSGKTIEAGDYLIEVSEPTDDGSEAQVRHFTGTATPEVPIAPISVAVEAAAADTTAPIVAAPPPLSVPANGPSGVRVDGSAALVAWLAAATASDDADPSPMLLETLVNGAPMTAQTTVPLGTHPVQFVFDDASGNIGSATSTITVAPDVPPPGTSLQIDGSTFIPGDTLNASLRLVPGLATGLVDAYFVVRLPSGSYLSLTPSGAVSGIVPYARRVTVETELSYRFAYQFSGGEPLGSYSLLGAMTVAGTGLVVDGIKESRFNVASTRMPLLPPDAFGASIDGRTVRLEWAPAILGATPTAWVIEAGSGPGLADLAVTAVDGALQSVGFGGVPPGTYYVRGRARLGTSVSVPSNEVVLTVR